MVSNHSFQFYFQILASNWLPATVCFPPVSADPARVRADLSDLTALVTLKKINAALQYGYKVGSNRKWRKFEMTWKRIKNHFNQQNVFQLPLSQHLHTWLKLRMLETDSEMKRIFARSQLTTSRKPSAAWRTHRHISQRWWQRNSWGGTWVPTLSRRCRRSSWGRMEGFKVVSVKALLVPAARNQNHFRLNRTDLSDVLKLKVLWEVPLRAFRCCTAFRSTVSLSSFRAMGWQAGIMADSSSIRLFILSRRRFSIWLWGSLQIQSVLLRLLFVYGGEELAEFIMNLSL